MSNISLAEAVKLKSVLSKRIHELEEEMNQIGFVEIEKVIHFQNRRVHWYKLNRS